MIENLDAALIPSIPTDPADAEVKSIVDPIAKAAGASQAERNALTTVIKEYRDEHGEMPGREEIVDLLGELRKIGIEGAGVE